MGTISMYFDLGILIVGPLLSWTKNKTDNNNIISSNSNNNFYYDSSFEFPVNLNLNSSSTTSSSSSSSSSNSALSRRGQTENYDGLLICKYEWSVVQYAYSRTEFIWSTLTIVLIFGVNGLVLWVIRKSRTLWNPRHLFMVYLCGTNLLMGCHKIVELIIVQWPRWELCVIHRATFGIPILANLILLTLISIDRFVAVKWPFFYIAHTSGAIKYVLCGSCVIVTVGATLGLSFITVAFLEPLKDINLWAMYLPLVTALCTGLILFFNTAVLRIARQQLCAMRALEASCHCNRPYSSCSVLSSFPTLKSCESESESGVVMDPNPSSSCKIPITPPIPARYCVHEYRDRNCNDFRDHQDKKRCQYQQFSDIQPLSPSTLSACSVSMNEVNRFSHAAPGTYGSSLSGSVSDRSFTGTGMASLNSRIGLQPHRLCPRGTNVWWRPSRFFHVKLSRSIRLARTFLLMTVPIFLVILPIAIIIPLRRSCDDSDDDHDDHYGNKRPYLYHYHCSGPVATLWEYLRIHVRSVLPIQAVTDALIYAFTCKEFVQCFHKVIRGRKQFQFQNSLH